MKIAITETRKPAAVTEGGLPFDALARYAAFIDAAPRTIDAYVRAVRRFLIFLRDEGISAPARADVMAWRDKLKASGHKPSTVQFYIVAVRGFFGWLAQEGLYPNIADRVKGARLDKSHKKDYLTAQQVKLTLAGIDKSTEAGARDYALLALLLACGLRTIEAARANVDDLCPLAGDTVLFVQGKGREEKTPVRVPPAVEGALRAYLQKRGTARANDPLFVSVSNNSLGERLTTRSISGIVKRCMVNAGFSSDRLTAHSTRHTAVTLALLAGKSLAEVQQFARHTNIQTTLIYSHTLEQQKNTCAATVADAIFGQSEV